MQVVPRNEEPKAGDQMKSRRRERRATASRVGPNGDRTRPTEGKLRNYVTVQQNMREIEKNMVAHPAQRTTEMRLSGVSNLFSFCFLLAEAIFSRAGLDPPSADLFCFVYHSVGTVIQCKWYRRDHFKVPVIIEFFCHPLDRHYRLLIASFTNLNLELIHIHEKISKTCNTP